MNNYPIAAKTRAPRKAVIYLCRSCCFLLCLVIMYVCFESNVAAQKPTWRYLVTVAGGTKFYINNDVRTLANKHVLAWEKTLKPDNAASVALAEWDCENKQRLTRQVTFYNPDSTVIGTLKKFDWTPVIPGSSADLLFRRFCSPVPPIRTAQIIVARADLRTQPAAGVVWRVARQGETFEVVPGTGQGGWYNVVEPETQVDFWLHGDNFKFVEPAEQQPKTAIKSQAPQRVKRQRQQ